DLHARLFAGVIGQDQEQATVERLRASFFGEGDGEFLRGSVGRRSRVGGRREGCAGEQQKNGKTCASGNPRQQARARSHLNVLRLGGRNVFKMQKRLPQAREAYFVLRRGGRSGGAEVQEQF